MNINGLGNKLAIGNGQKSQKNSRWQDVLFSNRFQEHADTHKKDVYEKSKDDLLYALTGTYNYYNIKSINRVTETGHVKMSAVIESEVRNISYMESDHIQVNVAEGYTYRAKVDVSGHSVYVEYRDDEGIQKGYVANVPSIEKDTENPIEQMALAAWNKVLEENRQALGYTEFKQPILSGATVPGKYVNGCFISEMTTWEDTIYFGKFGDACGMAGIFGGSWSDYYKMEEGTEHPDSYEIKLFTGRTVIIDSDRVNQIGRLKGVFSKAEYAQLMEALTEETGSIRMPQEKWDSLIQWTDSELAKAKEMTRQFVESQEKKAEETQEIQTDRRRELFKAPYSYLADDSGVIVYNGVTFICDEQTNSICLGDVSNPDDVITVPLSNGGSLKVNRDNLGDLAKAITMFSAEDRNRIMRAIQRDKKVQQLKQEIEDEKGSVGERLQGQEQAEQTAQANTQEQPKAQDTTTAGIEEDSGDSHIIVKPDGTRILVLTTKVGGMETQMSIKLSDGDEKDSSNEQKEDPYDDRHDHGWQP